MLVAIIKLGRLAVAVLGDERAGEGSRGKLYPFGQLCYKVLQQESFIFLGKGHKAWGWSSE
jgi:hypothetical protein